MGFWKGGRGRRLEYSIRVYGLIKLTFSKLFILSSGSSRLDFVYTVCIYMAFIYIDFLNGL